MGTRMGMWVMLTTELLFTDDQLPTHPFCKVRSPITIQRDSKADLKVQRRPTLETRAKLSPLSKKVYINNITSGADRLKKRL